MTVSTALKRLAGYTVKNHYDCANRDVRRVFKTAYIARILPILLGIVHFL